MRKVVHFDKPDSAWVWKPDLNLLNAQIESIENDGWRVLSVTANTNLLGMVMSYTILIELVPK
jgi:hypothetical protein